MTVGGFERFLKQRPFRPFTVREASGETHRVVSPETVLLAPKLHIVVIHKPDGDLVMVDLALVNSAFYSAAPKSKSKPKGKPRAGGE